MAQEQQPSLAPVALVTGGAAGIGWAICQRLAQAGYRIVIADRDGDLAASRAESLGAGHVALTVDLTDAQAASELVSRAAALFPQGLRLIVNNAGMTDTGGHVLCDMPQQAFERIIALNLTAVERICAAALQALAPGGAVVNIASGAAWRPLPLRGPYSATKAAVVALTEGLADTFAGRGLRISGVAPGYTLTPLIRDLSLAGRVDLKAVAASIPLARLAQPDDIAQAVAFLASDAGAALAGQVLLVDGGGSQGQASANATPAPGPHEGTGQIAWLGAAPVDAGLAHSSPDALSTIRPLAAVVDATALVGASSPAEALHRARETARACAAHPARCRDFALVFVLPAGGSATEMAAHAARAMLARTLALEWAGAGMRVNTIAWEGRDPALLEALCRFVGGPGAGYITGQTLVAGRLPATIGLP